MDVDTIRTKGFIPGKKIMKNQIILDEFYIRENYDVILIYTHV